MTLEHPTLDEARNLMVTRYVHVAIASVGYPASSLSKLTTILYPLTGMAMGRLPFVFHRDRCFHRSSSSSSGFSVRPIAVKCIHPNGIGYELI